MAGCAPEEVLNLREGKECLDFALRLSAMVVLQPREFFPSHLPSHAKAVRPAVWGGGHKGYLVVNIL